MTATRRHAGRIQRDVKLYINVLVIKFLTDLSCALSILKQSEVYIEAKANSRHYYWLHFLSHSLALLQCLTADLELEVIFVGINTFWSTIIPASLEQNPRLHYQEGNLLIETITSKSPVQSTTYITILKLFFFRPSSWVKFCYSHSEHSLVINQQFFFPSGVFINFLKHTGQMFPNSLRKSAV